MSKTATAYKILFVDLDDTLLDSNKEVSNNLRACLQRFLDAGFYFVISTGRALASAKEVIKYLKISGQNIYICAYNGSVIYNVENSEILYSDGIGLDCVKEIFEIAAKEKMYCQTYLKDSCLVCPYYGAELQNYLDILHMPYIITPDIYGNLLEQKKGDKQIVPKVVAVKLNDRKALEDFGAKIMPMLERHNATCMTSSDSILEILSKDCNKGTALVRVCAALNLPISASIACGDEANDVSMLKAAGMGVAMINGTNEAKAAADIISEYDADHDGVGHVIKALFGVA